MANPYFRMMAQVQYHMTGDTICALATPGGVGAIGVIRVSGPDAFSITGSVFRGKNPEDVKSHTVHLGKIHDKGNDIDEILATVFVAPRSYTGENTVELSCHGSPYIQQQILELLIREGCRSAKPGEFTLRAFLNKKLDLAQAEAVADLIASNSEESHRTAMMQMRGGFSEQIKNLRQQLIDFASLIELELDFSEEDVEFAERTKLKILVEEILSLIHSLIHSFSYGNAIRNGIPTVIAGKPNAGKSTLLNSLVNDERALVSEIAGTTRDTIEEAFVIEGIMFRLIDTAGIREHTSDIIEGKGIERTYQKIQQASIIIYLFDATQTSEEELKQELKKLEDIEAVIIPVANKVDLLGEIQIERLRRLENIQKNKKGSDQNLTLQEVELLSPVLVPVSSKLGLGMEHLKERMLEAVRKDEVKNDIIITNVRHYEALKNTANSLNEVLSGMHNRVSSELIAFDIRQAIYHLGEITGEITTDDLLANIFSRFCIGK